MEIRADILTPKERLLALMTGKPLDRIICMPIATSNTAQLIGKTCNEFQLDGKVMAESHIAGFKRFGYDLIYLFTNCSYVAEAMGAELVYYEDEPANCETPVINSREDLSKIKVAEKNDGKFPVFYEALEILNKEIGDQVFISVCFSGPVSTAATLRGVEAFARDTYTDPELCHTLLRMATDSCKNFIREFVTTYGAMPIILEPIASGSLFSPKMFMQIAYPYIKELVDPANELLFGPAEIIHEACKQAIDTMRGYTPTYILSTGCETSNKVPFEHIQAMMDVARSYGLYNYQAGTEV